TDGAGHQDRCTTTKATQSLFSSEKTSIIGNKVQITIYYDSGVKTALVTNAAYIKMCKAIFTNENVEKKLLTILKSTCPEDVVSCAASIIQSECASICKRKSAFVLNDKSYNGIMQFSWDTLHQQLLLGAPNTLQIVSSMASNDIPMSVPSKEFHHVLFAIGIALHARNREMTTLQYLNGMVLLHGGCTQRVCDIYY
ncbi:uncharacterized protein LOC128553656, partial [Mercenaria mercenaria]|uniref:uncharacterized protein LOC128553656 n=1 Tax=Mercenaria mercenaria TaxID=6596 RepID=UPI00234F6565